MPQVPGYLKTMWRLNSTNLMTNQQTNRPGPLKNQQPRGRRKEKDTNSSNFNNSHRHLRHHRWQSRSHLPHHQLPSAISDQPRYDSWASPDFHHSTTTNTGQNQETEARYCACTDFITNRQSTQTNDDLPSWPEHRHFRHYIDLRAGFRQNAPW